MKKHFLTYLFILALGVTSAFAQEKAMTPVVPICKLQTPNAFTPNSDGVNDFFYMSVSGDCQVKSFALKIFDRWGRLVFEADEISTQWDGTYDGQQLKEGVYLWQAAVTYADDGIAKSKTETKKGTLVLIR